MLYRTERGTRSTVQPVSSKWAKRYLIPLALSGLVTLTLYGYWPHLPLDRLEKLCETLVDPYATLAGFVLTAIAIYVGFIDKILIQKMKKDGRYDILLNNFMVAFWVILSSSLLSALVVLFPMIAPLALGWSIFALYCLFLAARRFMLTLRVLH